MVVFSSSRDFGLFLDVVVDFGLFLDVVVDFCFGGLGVGFGSCLGVRGDVNFFLSSCLSFGFCFSLSFGWLLGVSAGCVRVCWLYITAQPTPTTATTARKTSVGYSLVNFMGANLVKKINTFFLL